MRSTLDAIAFWLIDYYVAATLVLIVVALAHRAIIQPARRLALNWGALVGLVLLATFSLLPGWPRIDVPNAARAIRDRSDAHHKVVSQVSISVEAGESPDAASLSSTAASASSASSQAQSSPELQRSPLLANRPPARFSDSMRRQKGLPPQGLTAAALAEPQGFLRELANRDLGPARLIALAIFAVGSVLTAFRVIHGVIAARRVRLSASRAPRRVVDELERLAGKSRCPELLVSQSHPVPIATGTFWPRILLPRQFTERERPDDCRSVLAHELAHIQNGDLWLLALDRWLLPLFWMHPLYLRLRRSIRDDQELLADTFAARHSSRADYADMLVRWARRLVAEKRARQLAATVGVWDRPARLVDRISRLLQPNSRLELCCPRAWRMGSLLSLCVLPILLSTATMRPDVPRESNFVASTTPPRTIAAKPKVSPRCRGACTPAPETQECVCYSMEQPTITQINRLGGSVKKEPIGCRSFVTEVNMVFHYTEDGRRVDNTMFSADSLPHIAKFRHLKALSLAGGQITDAGLERLASLKELEELVLRDARGVSCSGVAELVKLPQLRRLELTGAPIGDAAFAELASLQALEELSVQGSNLSVQAVDIASRMPNLKSLSLELPNRIVGREVLTSLRALPNLKRLSLRCSKISNDAILELGALKQLRYLSLGDSRVSASALALLRRSLPNLSMQTNQQTLRDWPEWELEFRDDFVADEVLSKVRAFTSQVNKSRLRAAQLMTGRMAQAQYKVFALRIYPSLTNVNWKLAYVDSNAALAVSSEFSNHFGATLVFTCRIRRLRGDWKIEDIGATSIRDGVEKTVTRFAEAYPNARATAEWLAVPANVR